MGIISLCVRVCTNVCLYAQMCACMHVWNHKVATKVPPQTITFITSQMPIKSYQYNWTAGKQRYMQRTQKSQSTSCRKHSMEISKLPSWIYTKSTKHKRPLCGFNCCRSSLESSKGHNTGQFTCISCKNPCAWDSRACLGQMHLFGLRKTYWRRFHWNPIESCSSSQAISDQNTNLKVNAKICIYSVPHSLRYQV